MFKSYLLIAFRNFIKQRLFSFINVLGLFTSLVCTILIYLWIEDEISKDKFHHDINDIYHVVTNISNSEGIITWPITPGPLAEEIRTSIPEVQKVARIADEGPRLVQFNENGFMANGYFTDSDFVEIFSFPIANGNTLAPLSDPNSIMLTKSLATKLFGESDPIGKSVLMKGRDELKVTAVLEDVTPQSSLQFEFIAHFDYHKKNSEQSWDSYDYPLFIKFRKSTDPKAAAEKINNHVAKVLGLSDEDRKRSVFYLQPFADRYLNSHFENGVPSGGRIKYVQLFSIVAIFILIIGCINFMNITTAHASIRHKEIGVRKSVGAQSYSLRAQFLLESFLVALLAMVLAVLAVELILPYFNEEVSKQISIHYNEWKTIVSLVIIVIVAGLLAGSYPSFVLSRVNPVTALKGISSLGIQGSSFRKALVVFQFVISVVLIISSLVVYRQVQFIQSKDLGYSKENILLVPARGITNFQAVKNQIEQVPGVISVSVGNESIVNVQNQNSSFSWQGRTAEDLLYVRTAIVGYDFAETLNLKLVEGRSFQHQFKDSANVIINKKLASIINVSNPVGLATDQWGIKGKIVGVVEDFHSRSLSESIEPMVLLCDPDWGGKFYIRVEAGKLQETINGIDKVYKKASPRYPFEFSFLDDQFDILYKDEQVMGTLSIGFTFMAILISGLGLLGLTSYSINRRKKELSIRKTLGATEQQLITIMSLEFLTITFYAMIIGCPVAYFLMEQFLQGYAYHTNITYTVFLVTILSVSSFTLVTILLQVTKAAMSNPIKNLRGNE